MSRPRRIRRRHAQIHLPPRRGDEALRLVAFLDHVITAIRRPHGDAMDHELALRSLDAARSTSGQSDPDF